MSVSPPDPAPPTLTPGSVADQHSGHAESCDERHRLIGLAGQILASWPHLARLLVAATVFTVLVAGLTMVVFWLLHIDIQVGPVQVRR